MVNTEEFDSNETNPYRNVPTNKPDNKIIMLFVMGAVILIAILIGISNTNSGSSNYSSDQVDRTPPAGYTVFSEDPAFAVKWVTDEFKSNCSGGCSFWSVSIYSFEECPNELNSAINVTKAKDGSFLTTLYGKTNHFVPAGGSDVHIYEMDLIPGINSEDLQGQIKSITCG